MAKPFIKWAGGKNYLLNNLTTKLEHFDCSSYDYYEPMVGGGAVLFALAHRFKSATISDVNPDLINLYSVIKADVEALIAELRNGSYFYIHKSDSATLENYRRIRASDPTAPVQQAARIIFLLKTCFNGLMRVNSQGRFNVPPGSYTNPKVCDEDVLRASSVVLQDVTILGPRDATELIGNLPKKQKILLFVDPPYHHPPKKKSKNGGKFTGYSGEFDEADQTALIETMLRSGHKYIYTNRATAFIVSQFAGFSYDINHKLRHSIQPKYTTGAENENELIAYRL